MSAPSISQMPIRMGTPDQFVRVASALREAQFDQETVCRILKIKRMSEVGSPKSDDFDFAGVSEPLRIFIRLFLFLKLVPRPEVEQVLDSETLEAFLSLGLLRHGEFGSDHFHAPILLYPVEDFLMVSDRHSNPDKSKFEPPPDIVFPAIFGGTLRFLELLPKRFKGDALDLCGGSGIGAFALRRYGNRSISSDITERATQYALFNKALNDLDNVDIVCGDLFEPVKNQMFDCITAHPPYVPSLNIDRIWRDGGTTGDALVRRIVEGLPDRLRAGGMFCSLSLGVDTREGKFEERARCWLGEASDDFDIIFATVNERCPGEVLKELASREESLGGAGIKQFEEVFEKLGVVKMPYGALVIRRHSRSNQPPWSTRKKLSSTSNVDDFEDAFLFHERKMQPGFLEALEQAQPQLAPRLQVKVTHVVYEGSLVPGEYLFETDQPFDAVGRVDDWIVPLVLRIDGKTTPAEIFGAAKQADQLPEGFDLQDFTGLLARMLDSGYLVLPSSDN
jgi:SAM-dependent methyltransferase